MNQNTCMPVQKETLDSLLPPPKELKMCRSSLLEATFQPIIERPVRQRLNALIKKQRNSKANLMRSQELRMSPIDKENQRIGKRLLLIKLGGEANYNKLLQIPRSSNLPTIKDRNRSISIKDVEKSDKDLMRFFVKNRPFSKIHKEMKHSASESKLANASTRNSIPITSL